VFHAGLTERPNTTLQALRELTGFSGCLMTVWRALRHLGTTRRTSLRAEEQLGPAVAAQRHEWVEWMRGTGPDRFVFLFLSD
jgi:hypothetical protein